MARRADGRAAASPAVSARERIRSRKSVIPWTRQTLRVRCRPAPWRSCTSTVDPEEVIPPNRRAVMTELDYSAGKGNQQGKREAAADIPDFFGRNRRKASPVIRPVTSCTGR